MRTSPLCDGTTPLLSEIQYENDKFCSLKVQLVQSVGVAFTVSPLNLTFQSVFSHLSAIKSPTLGRAGKFYCSFDSLNCFKSVHDPAQRN